jgi:hypothetical protein
MQPFNAELVAKVQDKRLDAVEKLARSLAERLDRDDTAALLKKTTQELTEKIDGLQQMVRGLVETRGDSKLHALEKLVKLMAETMPKKAEIEKSIQDERTHLQNLLSSKDSTGDPKTLEIIQREIAKAVSRLNEERENLRIAVKKDMDVIDDLVSQKLMAERERQRAEAEERAEALRQSMRKEKELSERFRKEHEEKVAKIALENELRAKTLMDQIQQNQLNVISANLSDVMRRLSALESKK